MFFRPAKKPIAAQSQLVTITDTTSGTTIYYTTDGTTPTASSPKYVGPISVSADETIKAIAAASGDANGAVMARFSTLGWGFHALENL